MPIQPKPVVSSINLEDRGRAQIAPARIQQPPSQVKPASEDQAAKKAAQMANDQKNLAEFLNPATLNDIQQALSQSESPVENPVDQRVDFGSMMQEAQETTQEAPVDQRIDFDSLIQDAQETQEAAQDSPTDYTDVELDTLDFDRFEVNPTPADPPMMLTESPVDIQLNEGVTMTSEWPPESAKFTNPQTGEETLGFRIEMSTGDTYFIPEGSELTIRTPNSQFNVGMIYNLDQNGDANQQEAMRVRYASVFAI